MVSTLEYALMAGASYISTRLDANWFPVPQQWGERTDLRVKDDSSGFEATSFSNGTELVISYAGTYPKDLTGDIAADVALGTGVVLSDQLVQAAEYYLQVKALNPGATISLTGHSLGGGLAALVGVFFGVTAVTFDQAPFAQSARYQASSLLARLAAKRNAQGAPLYSSEALAPLASYIAQQQAAPDPTQYIPNTHLVSNILVQGEFLSHWLPGWMNFGASVEVIGNTAPDVGGGDLHSQALLAAYLQSRESAPSGRTPHGLRGRAA